VEIVVEFIGSFELTEECRESCRRSYSSGSKLILDVTAPGEALLFICCIVGVIQQTVVLFENTCSSLSTKINLMGFATIISLVVGI